MVPPKDYVIVMNDDVDKFAEEIKEWIAKGFMFLGELQIKDNILIREMVKVEPPKMPAPMTIPVPKTKQGDK